MILLITKYNLSSRWLHLFTFLILYLICLNMHYIDINNNNFVECMMRKPSLELPTLKDKNLFPEGLRSHAAFLDFSSSYSPEAQAEISNIIEHANKNVDSYQSSLIRYPSTGLDIFTYSSRKVIKDVEDSVGRFLNITPAEDRLKEDLDVLLRQKIRHAESFSMLHAEPKNITQIKNSQESMALDIRSLQENFVNHTNKFRAIEHQLDNIASNNAIVQKETTQKFITLESYINTKADNLAMTVLENEVTTNISTLQTELTNEINTRKALETRVSNLEEELREIRRALMFRGTIIDPLVQHQLTLNEVKQTTQENSIASIPR